MQSKYISATGGLFCIFSERLGVYHADIAEYCGLKKSITDAGFIYGDEDGFQVYGKSLSLDVVSNPKSEGVMNEALRRGEIRLYFFDTGMIATNVVLDGEFIPATSMGDLIENGIV